MSTKIIITVKNLQQQTFTVEFEREKTVIELKQKIFKERGSEYVIEKQKLIYAGVILEDKRTIASYNIDEKKFVVVMLKRELGSSAVKPDETATSSQASASAIKSVQSGVGSDSELEKISVPTVETTTSEAKESKTNKDHAKLIGSSGSVGEQGQITDLADALPTTSLQTRAESNWLTGEEYNRTVDSMIEMGYDREMVERAMAASFNNPERAVEYLISGIPENEGFIEPVDIVTGVNAGGGDNVRRIIAEGAANRPDSELTNRIRDSGDAGAEIGQNVPDPFEFLRNQPQFVQMRSLVYQNPELLHAVLQQIGQTNPALLQLISENQDAFLSMLNQPMADQTGSPPSQRRITPNRRAQLAAATARATSNADVSHVQNLDTEPGADGATPIQIEQGSVANADAATVDDNIADPIITARPDAAAVEAALTAAVSAVIDRDAHSDNNASTQAREGVPSAGLTDGIITLTQQDRTAIERLKQLGFPENLVLQAYFACDKDEELAANFLISSAFDD